jgi:glycerol-3-phosphate O-acyltransferase
MAEAYKQVTEGIRASALSNKELPPQLADMMSTFLDDYSRSNLDAQMPPEVFQKNIVSFFKTVQTAIKDPHKFEPFHKAIREPYDYYKFGNDFFMPLIIDNQSKLFGVENARKIREIITKGENVVILSNHQTEADPQVLSILLEKEGLGDVAENMIFIAGHKVTNDPVAIPFSMGRNLLCIHSKKHIKNPPEDAPRKQAENLETMKCLSSIMSAPAPLPGSVFWVAPSGGRDRPNPDTEEFVVAPFDAKAMDMFKIVAMQSKKRMHFFPMAMFTHQLVPPPVDVSSGLGEERSAKRGAVSVEFLPETDGLGGLKDKEFAADVQRSVDEAYQRLADFHSANSK